MAVFTTGCTPHERLAEAVEQEPATVPAAAEDPFPEEAYFVSLDGDDANVGTREAPWKTARHAGREARAGDTVVFLPGDYTGPLIPEHSGTADAPIVFQAAERRQAWLKGSDEGVWPNRGEGGRFRLENVAHITLKGFSVEDTSEDSSTGGWLWAENVFHLTIEDCQFIGGHRYAHFQIHNSEDITIRNSDFSRNRDGGDMALLTNIKRLLIEGNSFSRALHTMLGVRDSEGVVVRGNVFHAGWSRNFSFGLMSRVPVGPNGVLVENNLFVNAYNGSKSAGPGNQFTGNRHIFRFNQTFRNFGPTWTMAASSTRDTLHNRVYHNVFHGNHGPAWVASTGRGNFRDLILENNIFSGNDPHGSGTQLVLSGGGAESAKVRNNTFYAETPDHPSLFRYRVHPLSLAQAQGDASYLREATGPLTETTTAGSGRRLPVAEAFHFVQPSVVSDALERDTIFVSDRDYTARLVEVDNEAGELVLDRDRSWDAEAPVGFHIPMEHVGIFHDNRETEPLFLDPANFDFSLAGNSSLRNSGKPLTMTRSAGGGGELPVEDAYSFYDGFGINGEVGDVIAVGSPGNRARIVKADPTARVLHLDRDLEWEAKAPVSLPWSHSAPDIGVYEHGDKGRANVQVRVDRPLVQAGEPVRLRALVRGMRPPYRYEWHLGDGTVAHGETVRQVYSAARDYGVRLRVTDANETTQLGVAYVSAEPPQDPNVLIHTTFDADDKEWWVHWQFYRGRRASGYARYRHMLDEATGEGYVRIFPRDPDPSPLPAFLHPRNWDIDQYPTVRIRYRIRRDTPIAIFVRPFPSAYHTLWDMDASQDGRRYYFAGTPGVLDGTPAAEGEGGPRGRGPLPDSPFPQTLIADGEWHEITFDVREIREKFSEVQVLQALHIGDLEVDGGASVSPGDQFWLDEIYIGK